MIWSKEDEADQEKKLEKPYGKKTEVVRAAGRTFFCKILRGFVKYYEVPYRSKKSTEKIVGLYFSRTENCGQ